MINKACSSNREVTRHYGFNYTLFGGSHVKTGRRTMFQQTRKLIFLATTVSFFKECKGQSDDPDTAIVFNHVKDAINQTFREPSDQLLYPYQVPGN